MLNDGCGLDRYVNVANVMVTGNMRTFLLPWVLIGVATTVASSNAHSLAVNAYVPEPESVRSRTKLLVSAFKTDALRVYALVCGYNVPVTRCRPRRSESDPPS